jgi:hypothetical protein
MPPNRRRSRVEKSTFEDVPTILIYEVYRFLPLHSYGVVELMSMKIKGKLGSMYSRLYYILKKRAGVI